jgi:hypothetical protein
VACRPVTATEPATGTPLTAIGRTVSTRATWAAVNKATLAAPAGLPARPVPAAEATVGTVRSTAVGRPAGTVTAVRALAFAAGVTARPAVALSPAIGRTARAITVAALAARPAVSAAAVAATSAVTIGTAARVPVTVRARPPVVIAVTRGTPVIAALAATPVSAIA